jgi:tripartite-type tricarboxylate transporter receptor subunit TctC
MIKIKHFLALSVILLTGLGSSVVQAQKFPDKPVKIVVPFAPGGGADLLARTMSVSLTERWGQPVVVENRPGASGNIGAEIVARAEPDGYTMLLTSSAFVISPGMTNKLPFNVEKDFTPITLAVELPNVLVVHPSVKANSVAELVALIKENKTKINYASPGNGTGGHLAAELFKQSAGVDVLHVPYKGGGAVIADLLAGHVQMTFATLPSVMAYISSGRVRPLALTTAKRGFIEVPTMIESGFVGFDLSTWLGFLGPAGMSPAIVNKLNTDLIAVMKSPQISEKIKQQGMLEVASTPTDFAEKIVKDVQMYKGIIQKSGAKTD